MFLDNVLLARREFGVRSLTRPRRDLIRHLSWTVAGGCGCAVLIRGLDAMPPKLYRNLGQAGWRGRAGFCRPNRVALGPEAEEFACWRRAYRALADAE